MTAAEVHVAGWLASGLLPRRKQTADGLGDVRWYIYHWPTTS